MSEQPERRDFDRRLMPCCEKERARCIAIIRRNCKDSETHHMGCPACGPTCREIERGATDG